MFGSFAQQQSTQPATQSAAGGLFGSTTAAQPAQSTGFGGFGQQQQTQQQQQPAPQGTGLFGATNTAQPPATGGLFGGFGNQPKPAGGLFGAPPTTAITNPPAPGGLFGSTTTQPQQAGATSGGLFGNVNQSTAAQTAPATTGSGLFGNPAATTTTAQPTIGGGLFGNQQASGTAATGTGLFGSTTTTQPATGGLFGNAQQAQLQGAAQPAQPSTLFGAPAATAQQQQPAATGGLGLFGQPKPAITPTGLSLGTSTAPTTQVGGNNTTVQASEITGSTKFNDLPDEFKKIFEAVETGIQKQTNIAQELKSKNLAAEPDKGRAQLQRVAKIAIATDNTLSLDSGFVADLKVKGSQALDELVVATKIVDGFLHPHQYPDNLTVWAGFPFAYFSALSDQLSERLQRYKLIVEQIERKIVAASSQAQTSPQ
ncbi:hypothetical protein FRC01_007353, partial [Tulasnella sp. 417]